MEVYIIRHADALPLGEGGTTTDADRPLSPTGKAQTRALAASLQQHGVLLSHIATSPLLRAKETAEGLIQAWSPPPPALETCEELAPGGRSKRLAKYLRELKSDAVGLVGHQPDLSEHVAWLIGSKRAQLDMAKAGVAAIHIPEDPSKGAGVLLWLITPDWWQVRK